MYYDLWCLRLFPRTSVSITFLSLMLSRDFFGRNNNRKRRLRYLGCTHYLVTYFIHIKQPPPSSSFTSSHSSRSTIFLWSSWVTVSQVSFFSNGSHQIVLFYDDYSLKHLNLFNVTYIPGERRIHYIQTHFTPSIFVLISFFRIRRKLPQVSCCLPPLSFVFLFIYQCYLTLLRCCLFCSHDTLGYTVGVCSRCIPKNLLHQGHGPEFLISPSNVSCPCQYLLVTPNNDHVNKVNLLNVCVFVFTLPSKSLQLVHQDIPRLNILVGITVLEGPKDRNEE